MSMADRFRGPVRAILGWVLLSCATVGEVAAEPYRNQWSPTMLEISQLPRFCRGQFIPEERKVWLATIAPCGTYMNHFCPGLVLINRAANASKSKVERREDLRMARGEIEYTRNFLKQPCPIEDEIQGAESRIKVLQIFLK